MLAIHDVGAGGISNAFPELVDGAGRGATFDLRQVPLEETGLAPKEIWCNESQERYVLALDAGAAAACSRRCARASAARSRSSAWPPRRRSWCSRTARAASASIDMPMEVLLGKPPKMQRDVQRVGAQRAARST